MFGFKKKDLSAMSEWAHELSGLIADGVREKVLSDAMEHADTQITDVLRSQDSVASLTKQVVVLEETVAKLKSKAHIEETEFKALIKLREDRQSLELEKKSVAMEKEYLGKEMGLLKTSHTDQIDAIKAQSERLDKFMGDVMKKLTHIRDFNGSGPQATGKVD